MGTDNVVIVGGGTYVIVIQSSSYHTTMPTLPASIRDGHHRVHRERDEVVLSFAACSPLPRPPRGADRTVVGPPPYRGRPPARRALPIPWPALLRSFV